MNTQRLCFLLRLLLFKGLAAATLKAVPDWIFPSDESVMTHIVPHPLERNKLIGWTSVQSRLIEWNLVSGKSESFGSGSHLSQNFTAAGEGSTPGTKREVTAITVSPDGCTLWIASTGMDDLYRINRFQWLPPPAKSSGSGSGSTSTGCGGGGSVDVPAPVAFRPDYNTAPTTALFVNPDPKQRSATIKQLVVNRRAAAAGEDSVFGLKHAERRPARNQIIELSTFFLLLPQLRS